MNNIIQHHAGDISYGSIIKHTFDISDISERFHYYTVDCGGCTSAEISGNNLTISIDTTKSGAISGQFYRLHKSCAVYLDKDIPEFISDEKTFKRIPNPNKKYITFIITANVI